MLISLIHTQLNSDGRELFMQIEHAQEAQRLFWFTILYVLYQLYSAAAGQLFGLC